MTKKMRGNAQVQPEKKASTRARQLAFLEAYTSVTCKFNVALACKKSGISRRIYYKWMETDQFRQDLDEAVQGKIDQVEAALFGEILTGNVTAIIFFLKTIGKSRGYVEGERVRTVEPPHKQAAEILDNLISGALDPLQASLKFDRAGLPLPDGLKIILGKFEPPPPPIELPPSMSDEELEAGYRAEMARVNQQKVDWLPERRREVEGLKDELKGVDSWGADATEIK